MQITIRYVRTALAALVSIGALAAVAPAAQAAFGPESFEAGTCLATSCEYTSPPSAFYTQAAGHPPWGITKFTLNHSGNKLEGAPLKRIRVDVPPGLAANPVALPTCTHAQFDANSCPAETKVGTTELEAILEAIPGIPVMLPQLSGDVYNLDTPAGLPLDFGINVQPAGELVTPVHLFLEGHVVWNGDYHEYFEINNIPDTGEIALGPIHEAVPLTVLSSQLNFNGQAGQGNFLTLPSVCSASTTSDLEVESYAGETARTETHTPVGVAGCDKVPFSPTAKVTPETAQNDTPDGVETVVSVPQNIKANQINTADIRDASVTLPEGLTLNPAAAHGLEACSAAQIGIGTRNAVACPAGSNVGTVKLETDLPPGSLTGNVYLGSPSGGLITDPPFTIYLVAQNANLDVSVRLQGTVEPNRETGRLEVSFLNNPQLPFSSLSLKLNGGDHAPLANPLSCDAASTSFVFTPYAEKVANATGSAPFATTGCPASTPFALTQSIGHSSPNAGAYTSYTFNLARTDGQQYLGKLSTTLPAGLVGAIPSVPLCAEVQAQAGTCAAASQIGTATAYVGSGGDPYPFTGPVFLTGPYAGAPYGLSIPIAATAGPFALGTIVTRATINVDPHTSRVIATSTLPTIFKGIPLRLRNIGVNVNRANFLFNPTNCGPLSTDTSLTSTLGATQGGLSSPFSVGNCSTLPFKPNFSAASNAATNPTQLKANGASLRVNLLQGVHEANIHSVVAELPKSLPSRLTTLQKACPEATYTANPFSCPAGSKVGSATVTTPVLPQPLKGPAYLVSHGGAAFPDLDLLLEGDGGVRVILEGNTDIKNGITKSTFASIPDVPVSSFVLDLPQGANSVFTAIGGALCSQTLIMPTTITAQSGTVIKQNTNVGVEGCTGGKGKTRFKILSKKIVKNKLVVRVQTYAPGRVSLKSRYLRTTYKHFAKAGKFTIKAPLSRKGIKGQRAHKLKFRARVGFYPKSKAEAISAAFTNVGFKHNAKKHKKK
jgi:hypothetical protein